MTLKNMESRPHRHHNCTLTFESFRNPQQLSEDCPVCLRSDPAWHCWGAHHPQSQASKYQTQRTHHFASTVLFTYFVVGPLPFPQYPGSVFIFGDTASGGFQPVGTCFAISPQYLLTAQHNMQSQRLGGYGIAPFAVRRAGAVVVRQGFPRPVRVRYFNTAMDYAVLEVCDNCFDLVPVPISLEVVEADMDLKVYHCPVDTFNEGHVEDLTVFSNWVKAARPTNHHVACNVGLYGGSSGGPFISRSGGAIGMHIESVSTAREIDKTAIAAMSASDAVEILSETVNSHANGHASFSRALLFRTCPGLINALQGLGIV